MAILLEKDFELPEYDMSLDVPWDEQPQEMVLNELTETSNNLPEGEIVGAVLKFPVADGHAFYLVTDDDPLMVQYIMYGDCYYVHPALIRGLEREDVLHQLADRKWWNDMATKANQEEK